MQASLPQTFIQFGGHKYSGGFAVANDEIHFLEQRLNEVYGLIDDGDQISKKEVIDMELTIDEIDSKLYEQINKLAPFGIGNPKPLFLFRKVTPVVVRKFGKTNDHVEIVFKKKNGQKISAIAFFGAKERWADEVREGTVMDLIASVEKSMFRGRAEIRLRVEDVYMSDICNADV
jgi:single-stranded-DNA-specific exonuclease